MCGCMGVCTSLPTFDSLASAKPRNLWSSRFLALPRTCIPMKKVQFSGFFIKLGNHFDVTKIVKPEIKGSKVLRRPFYTAYVLSRI